jgi:hypothetical protein
MGWNFGVGEVRADTQASTHVARTHAHAHTPTRTHTRTRTHTHVRAHTHTRTRARAHTRTHTHTHAHAHQYTHTHTHTHTHARARARRYTHARAHTHTHTHVRAHTHTRARTRAHTPTHTRTRTHTRARAQRVIRPNVFNLAEPVARGVQAHRGLASPAVCPDVGLPHGQLGTLAAKIGSAKARRDVVPATTDHVGAPYSSMGEQPVKPSAPAFSFPRPLLDEAPPAANSVRAHSPLTSVYDQLTLRMYIAGVGPQDPAWTAAATTQAFRHPWPWSLRPVRQRPNSR